LEVVECLFGGVVEVQYLVVWKGYCFDDYVGDYEYFFVYFVLW